MDFSILEKINKQAIIAIFVIMLGFMLFIPQIKVLEPSLSIVDAKLTNNTLSLSLNYTAPFPKICYIVIYGPFNYAPNNQEGNNVFVLNNNKGILNVKLNINENYVYNKVKAELWCENKKKVEVEKELS